MKLHALESALSEVGTFVRPKIMLEQYPTSPHLASVILHTIDSTFDDIQGRSVGDLGCGTGIFSAGAALLGAAYVLAVDIDEEALKIARENMRTLEVEHRVDLLCADLQEDNLKGGNGGIELDTVVMNPPFGTRVKGIDLIFLRAAFNITAYSVYSLHKSSTRHHIDKKTRTWGAFPQVIAQLRFDIPHMYSHHQQSSQDIEVDLWRFDVRSVLSKNLPSASSLLGSPSASKFGPGMKKATTANKGRGGRQKTKGFKPRRR